MPKLNNNLKTNNYGKGKCFLRSFIVVLMAMVVSVSFISCDKNDAELNYMVKSNGGTVIPGTNTEIKTTITRDAENGIAKAEMFEDGQFVKDTTVVVPLGGVRFEVSKNDTIYVANNSVEHRDFTISAPKTTNYDESGVYYTKSVREFVDAYDKYTKTGSISYLDAYTYVWGVRCDFLQLMEMLLTTMWQLLTMVQIRTITILLLLLLTKFLSWVTRAMSLVI